MAERTVMQAGFAYWVDRPLLLTEDGKPTRDEALGSPALDENGDQVVLRFREFATKGETITLSDVEAKRGDELGVFTSTSPEQAHPSGDDMSDVRGKSVDELVEWLENEQPGVRAAVAACQGDGNALSALLEAYKDVTDGEPPDTVVKAVEAFQGAGNADGQDTTTTGSEGSAEIAGTSGVEVTTETNTTGATPVEVPADYNELKKLAKSLGLKASGTRDALTDAVKAKLAEQAPA